MKDEESAKSPVMNLMLILFDPNVYDIAFVWVDCYLLLNKNRLIIDVNANDRFKSNYIVNGK